MSILVPFDRTATRLPGPDIARSLAIAAVIACHGGLFTSFWFHLKLPLHLLYLGFHGVMLFFVLSGFLIGTIMLDLVDRDAPLRAWGVFLVRRWARTLPAYYAWLLLLLVPLGLAGHDTTRAEMLHVWPWYLTLTQNLFWKPVSAWFGVTWSLCVEEWFYLLFPACILFFRALGLRGSRGFVSSMMVFMLVPLAWRLSMPSDVRWDEITSKMAICRFDSIGWGVLAAFACRRFAWFDRRALPLLIVGSVLFGFMWWHDGLVPGLNRFGTEWNEAMLDVTAFGFALCMPATLRFRHLSGWVRRAARTVSTHSYALYLGHLPLILLAGDLIGRGLLTPALAVGFSLATMVAGAVLSWRLVERPILRMRPGQI